MIALCRLSALGFLAVVISTDAATVRRKKKHHHHHHHAKHRGHHNASSVNKTHSIAFNKSTGLNATDGVAGQHGLLDVSNPKSSLGAAAVHAAAHAALHRHVATRVGHVTQDTHQPKGPVHPATAGAAEDRRERAAAENRSLRNRSTNATEPSVALAHTAVHVNSSARAEKHPHAHRRQPAAPDAAEDAARKGKAAQVPTKQKGQLLVGGPLPPDFEERFVEGVAEAAHVPEEAVQVLSVGPAGSAEGADIDKVVFTAPKSVVRLAEDEAGDPSSRLASGPLRIFLVDRSAEAPEALSAPEAEAHHGEEADAQVDEESDAQHDEHAQHGEVDPLAAPKAGAEAVEAGAEAGTEAVEAGAEAAEAGAEAGAEAAEAGAEVAEAAVEPRAVEAEAEAEAVGEEAEADAQHGEEEEEAPPGKHAGGHVFDVDSEMPYGDLEPFGREDTASELTGSSIRESDQMVDQLERAEVAEEKRAVFRALTRLRGAAITSFDGIARSQTGNIDEYNKRHRWRETHPLHHLADEESDVAKWAFPEDC